MIRTTGTPGRMGDPAAGSVLTTVPARWALDTVFMAATVRSLSPRRRAASSMLRPETSGTPSPEVPGTSGVLTEATWPSAFSASAAFAASRPPDAVGPAAVWSRASDGGPCASRGFEAPDCGFSPSMKAGSGDKQADRQRQHREEPDDAPPAPPTQDAEPTIWRGRAIEDYRLRPAPGRSFGVTFRSAQALEPRDVGGPIRGPRPRCPGCRARVCGVCHSRASGLRPSPSVGRRRTLAGSDAP